MDLTWSLRPLLTFIFEKAIKVGWQKLSEKFGPSPLTLELPEPVNPMGHVSSGGHFTPGWSVKLRFTVHGDKPRSILELQIEEDEVGPWQIVEVFYESTGRRVPFPIEIKPTKEFWVRANSPRSYPALPVELGKLTLRVRDHKQPAGRYRIFPMAQASTLVR